MADTIFIQVRKGLSPSTLEPSFVVSIPPAVKTLSALRQILVGHSYMSEADIFLNTSLYKIRKEDEKVTSLGPAIVGEKGKETVAVLEVPAPTEPVSNEPVDAPDGTLRILKGSSVDALKPFTATTVGKEIQKLRALREALGPIMARSDRFLTLDKFPVDDDKESDIDWAHIVLPTAPEATHVTKTVAILSTGSKPLIPPPVIKDRHQFDSLPQGKAIEKPSLTELPVAVAGQFASQPQPNAKMLSEDQVKSVFDINSLCSGLWLNHPSHPRAFSTLFTPKDTTTFKEMIQLADASSIESHTKSSERETTMLKQGFSSVEASIATPWISASAAVSDSDDRSDASSKSRSYVTSIYRYPRAIVQMDVTKFDASPEFIKDRNAAFTEEDDNKKRGALTKLFKKYGHVFAAHVELGGLLHSTRVTTTDATDVQTAAEHSVRATLSAQTQTVSGSASVESGDKSKSENKNSTTADRLAVEAVGGDTTLASNPTLWPSSTIPYVNWRATKFSDVSLLTDIPSLFESTHKAEVDRLFPPVPHQGQSQGQVQPKKRGLIGYWAKLDFEQLIPNDWFPAAARIQHDVKEILFVKQDPSLPDPNDIFAPPMGYNQVSYDSDWYYEPFAEDPNYKAVAVVFGDRGFPVRTDVVCVNKKYLEWVKDSKREMPIYQFKGMHKLRDVLKESSMNKTKYQYGCWQLRLDMVRLVT